MADDVVAELDRWRRTPRTAENAHEFVPMSELLIRARDEIVALRKLTDGDWVWQQITDTRAAALEEAAGLCELSAQIMQPDERRLGDAIAAVKSCAAAIRALKDKQQ